MNNNKINKIQEKISFLNNMAQTFLLQEKYDISNAQKLLHCDMIDEEYKGSLRKYLKHGKSGSVEVEYTINDIGRLNARVKSLKKDETSITQCLMWREAKAALCKKNYVDLDMVNCHPVLLEQIFKELKYDTKVLTGYNKSRDIFFKKMEKSGITRDQCKVLIMRLFYNGTISAWCKDNKVEETILKGTAVHALDRELKRNCKKILQTNELLKYRLEAIKKKGNDYHNLDGTAMAYYLQTMECKCLLVMYNYLIKKGRIVGALIHDGLHLEKSRDTEDEDFQELISEIKTELKNKTGFDIDLKIKDFQHIEELDNIICIESDKEGADYISDKLKNDYIISHERIFMRVNNVWTTNEKVIRKELIKAVGNMNIFFGKGEEWIPAPYSTMATHCNHMLQYVLPTEDEDFIDKLWSSNLQKLCFKNGYYDFKKGKLVDYDLDTLTTIKINRDFKAAEPDFIEEVYSKILNPIFNNDKELRDCWLNYIARGVAGHIEDKNWGVGIGERDCGKGVLVGLLENCFGDYCRATNSENFLYKNNGTDSAKALSWLVPFEFKRLLLTNEITRDSQGKYKINGNVLKKLSSGGDKIEARVNHKDEINFKIQARVCMFCNDLPPIEPADTKETSYMFRYPSKFLNKGDKRLGKPLMRPKIIVKNDEIEYILDKDGEKIMENVCNFYPKDDAIKEWAKSDKVLDAFIEILFTHYGERTDVPESMKEEMEDFKEEENEEDKFLSLFNFPGDLGWEDNQQDYISISQINSALRKAHINLSPQKYKNYLTPRGAVKLRRIIDNKKAFCWYNVQINKDNVQELTEELTSDD
tara:strand:+ start:2476 stop:4920 length:2445 start_codon:yes stop_codon:yes gene_type:complete